MTSAGKGEGIPARHNSIRAMGVGATCSRHKSMSPLSFARQYRADPNSHRCFPLDDAPPTPPVTVARGSVPQSHPGTMLIEYPFYHRAPDRT
jgi:hypothetical protein